MSEEAEIALAREKLKTIPLLAGHVGPVERLGGLTNLVFRVGDHCLRIPGKGTEEYIDRINEMIATEAAAVALRALPRVPPRHFENSTTAARSFPRDSNSSR